jgi:hypothetical protein
MQDFVALQKWDHHGAADLKLTTERSQRKLLKCRRQAIAAAREPVTPIFARLSKAMGISTLKCLVAGLSIDTGREEETAVTVNTGLALPRTSLQVGPPSQDLATVVHTTTSDAAAWLEAYCKELQKGTIMQMVVCL